MVGPTDVHGAAIEGNPGFVHLRVTNAGAILFAGTVRDGTIDHVVTSVMFGMETMI
ncbi:hypothetical protein LCGC14_2778010, partial [marine sediment metagenome]